MPFSRRLLLVVLAAAGACRTPPRTFFIEDRGRAVIPPAPPTERKPAGTERTLAVEYSFRTFDDEPLSARFEIDRGAYESQSSAWGYKDADLDALKAWRDGARRAAYDAAMTRHATQAELDAELETLQKSYRQRYRDYINSRGFALEPGGVAKVDMAGLIRRSAPLLAPLARELERRAKEKGRGEDWLVAAAASFVQTAIVYKDVPSLIDGLHTGGVWIPAKTLLEGWGDCDTKVALLASIVANWGAPRMIIVELPDHYLLGLRREPKKGESYVNWEGSSWVLIEAAGPAWLSPGALGDDTKELFQSGRGYVIEPVLF